MFISKSSSIKSQFCIIVFNKFEIYNFFFFGLVVKMSDKIFVFLFVVFFVIAFVFDIANVVVPVGFITKDIAYSTTWFVTL